MCLGVPGMIQQISADEHTAVVDFSGVRREVCLDLVDEPVSVGDHVLVHVGFAIRRIAPEDLAETLAFFATMAAEDLEGLPPPTPPAPAAQGDP
jgi:hydrogenase expression/formation protein HypC